MSTKNVFNVESFSERLKTFRGEKGFSVQKMADIMGIPKGTYYSAETGTEPGAAFLFGFSNAWPNDLHWLLTGKRPDTVAVEPDERTVLEGFRKTDPDTQQAILLLFRRDMEKEQNSLGGKLVGTIKGQKKAK